MRLVISHVSSSTYWLSKFLDLCFKLHVNYMSPHSIKNALSLVNKIKEVVPPPPRYSSLISFDVVGLFPYIPNALTIQLMGRCWYLLLSLMKQKQM